MNRTDTPFKVLVVDDNAKNIQVIGSVLKEDGYEVGFALNGQQALEILNEAHDYDLVLLDILMPGMDGFAVCRAMKKDDRMKEIPIIFLSASSDMETVLSALDAGGVDYVTKPFNTKELLSRVHTHIQLRRDAVELQKNARELEKLNMTKDKFFSILAHDLRNPFEGILLITRTLLEIIPQVSKEEIRKQLELIISATEGGHKLLENLLIWSKSQTGRIKYNPSTFNLGKVVHRTIADITPQARTKNIRIQYREKPENITLTTDEAMLCVILRNLLSNAVKFTPGPGTVTVSAKIADGDVTISVIDSGIGISEYDRERLFLLDGKISSRPGTANETGSGLGLILCREFLDKMGGTIEVHSESGKGSRFTFTLPQGK